MTDASPPDAAVLRSVDRRGVATLTLNRPEKGNSYNQAMLDTLLAEVTRLGADPAVRVIVLRAGGKHFCVGAEIGEEHAGGERRVARHPSWSLPRARRGPEADRRARPRRLHRRRRRACVLLRHRHRCARCVLFIAGGAARLCAGAADSVLSACGRGTQPAPLSAVGRALCGRNGLADRPRARTLRCRCRRRRAWRR